MGLPLFIAPVESDIPSQPVAKSPADPANARSPIRRSDRRRQLNETREHRLRLLAALQGNISLADRDSVAPPETDARPTENEEPSLSGTPRFVEPSPRFVEPSSLDFDDDAMMEMISAEAFRGRRDALRSNPALPGADGSVQEESYLRGDLSYVSWHDAQYFRDPPSQQTQTGGARSRDASSRRMRFVTDREMSFLPGRPRPPVVRRQSSNDSLVAGRPSRSRNPDPAEYLEEYRRRRNLQAPSAPTPLGRYRPHRPVRSVRYMDGLGDRDRSLSPEGDSVWDTLQSTLTPDPQPPSIGSSFASTNASAATSQTTASSSNTSITNPDEEVEPPCDPVADNLDTDDEGDEQVEEQPTESSRRPTPHSERRSYADVVAAGPAGDDRNERLEWLSDMQRIVQGLASRQDIPDQWWAAAGLSRSMTSG